MSVQKRTLFDFCANRDPFSLSGLRAGLREGAAVSRGDLTVDLQPAVVVDKTKFPELSPADKRQVPSVHQLMSAHVLRQEVNYRGAESPKSARRDPDRLPLPRNSS